MKKSSEHIRTPDQKLRVFVSSTLRELADERIAVRASIESMRMIPVMFELGARPHPPKDLYQAYLRQSDIFVGIYWESYGWIAENETISGLEDEYRLSDPYPKLIYVKEPAPGREAKLKEMLDDIRSRAGVSYKSFRTSEELAKYLSEDLAIMLSERFYSASQSVEVEDKPKIPHTNLPSQMPQIIGREADIESIRSRVADDDCHLITITGPGGIGKTRLALAVAASLADSFEDGVYFIDLSDIKEGKHMFLEISSSLGMHVSKAEDPVDKISGFIAFQKILIVLDNCEHLASSAKAISNLMKLCPNLFLIITSRSILNLTIESVYHLKALPAPSVTDEFKSISSSPSVQVFLNKANSVAPDFRLTEENCNDVAEICRILDGIPLAIGLAAVKVRVFTPKMILKRLANKLSLLSGGSADSPDRHKTMRAAIEWSYELLDENEKTLFMRLAVFAGSFDFESVDSICGDGNGDSFELLESLLLKNLLKRAEEIEGMPRYSMPSLFHEFAGELFLNSGEAEQFRLRHAEHYYREAINDKTKFTDSDSLSLSRRWGFDAANVIEAADTFRIRGRYAELIELIYSLWKLFWIFDEEPALEQKFSIYEIMSLAKNLTKEQSGKLLWIAGASSLSKGDNLAAEYMFKQALECLDESEEKSGVAWANHLVTSITASELKPETYGEVIKAFESSLKIFREIGDLWGESGVMLNMAALETIMKHYSKALKLYDEFERMSQAAGNDFQIAHLNIMRGWIFSEQKDNAKAAEYFRKGMEHYKDGESPEALCYGLTMVSLYLFKMGKDAEALYLAGLLENIMTKYHFTPWQMLAPMSDLLKKKLEKKSLTPEFGEYRKALREGVFKGIRIANEILQSVGGN